MNRIENKTVPLFCWDICAMNLYEISKNYARQEEFNLLQDFQRKFDWAIELDSVLKNSYEALVLTDNHQVIQWVSKGFQKMTGYPTNFAIGKNPRFLQGEQSSAETKNSIRGKLNQSIAFTEIITNYRKSGESYLCELHIYPIENQDRQLTHFLALEQEIR